MARIIKVLFFFSFVTLTFCYAQVGINTENIESNLLLKIQPKNTISPNITTVDKSGNMGIGTISPKAKLDIQTGGTAASPNSQLIIDDGTQKEGRVLQSDANGVTSWAEYSTRAIFGNFTANGKDILAKSNTLKVTDTYISLPPGTWIVFCNISIDCRLVVGTRDRDDLGVTGARIYAIISFSENQSNNNTTPDLLLPQFMANSILINSVGSISGRCIISNKTNSTKNYYLMAGTGNENDYTLTNLFGVGKASDANSLFAFLINI